MPVAKLTRTKPKPLRKDGKIKRPRTTSCERCQKRKQKCDHKLPVCTNCLKAYAQCIQPERYSEAAEETGYTESLENKIADLEAEVKRLTGSSMVGGAGGSFVSANQSQNPNQGHCRSNRVSILNSDNGSAPPPQSFTVVSSLLQETYWGQANTSGETEQIAKKSKGLLFDYDFSAYLMYMPDFPSPEQADALLAKFLGGSLGKFTFIDRTKAQQWHDAFKREALTTPDPAQALPSSSRRSFERIQLLCIYTLMSISDHKTLGEPAQYNPFGYYATAIRYAQQCEDFTQPTWPIITLLMFSFIQMRTDKDRGIHFEMARKALSLCEELGLHEGRGFETLSLYDQEMHMRLFWSVYSLERLFAISTGRAFVLDQERITVSFPSNLDDRDVHDDEKILEARGRTNPFDEPVTTMSFVIHMWRLKQFETEMVKEIYNTAEPLQNRFAKVDGFLARLDKWKEATPTLHNGTNQQNQQMMMMAYARNVRLMLQPFLAMINPDSDLFRSCVKQTGLICHVLREYYRNRETGFTTLSTHSAFVAGLTLIYCLWLAKDSSILYILENLRCCTSVLYTLTERTRLCMEYRDTFESLMNTTMKNVIEHRGRIREQRKQGRAQRRKFEMADMPSNIPDGAHPLQTTPQPVGSPPISRSASSNGATAVPQGPQGSPAVLSPKPPYTAPVYPTISISEPYLQQPPQQSPQLSRPPSAPETSQTLYQEVYQNMQLGVSSGGTMPLAPPPPPPMGLMHMNNQNVSDNYGYNDTLYNMIQDISQWVQHINQVTPQDPESIFHDEIWKNVSEINYS